MYISFFMTIAQLALQVQLVNAGLVWKYQFPLAQYWVWLSTCTVCSMCLLKLSQDKCKHRISCANKKTWTWCVRGAGVTQTTHPVDNGLT